MEERHWTVTGINGLVRLPTYPEAIQVVVEQPVGEVHRIDYYPETETFERSERFSLLVDRGFPGAYGWIAGTGLPPLPHHDAFLLTEGTPQPGAVVEAMICGVFKRGDGDHKFVAVDVAIVAKVGVELERLPPYWRDALKAVYPVVGEGEGWFGAYYARQHLASHEPTHD